MLLRRLMQHVESQNWIAVGLDFAIVVLGVFIGLQVNNLNQARLERDVFERQLLAVAQEMSENVDRFSSARAAIERQRADVDRLRRILDDATIDVSSGDLHAMLMQSIHVIGVYPKRSALDVVMGSELLANSENAPLADAFEQWDAVLARLRRLQDDALGFRALNQAPYIVQRLHMAPVVATSLDASDIFVSQRFSMSRDALSQDRAFENILATRQLQMGQDVNRTSDLVAITEQIILLIGARTMN
jgi:hypothetical protein